MVHRDFNPPPGHHVYTLYGIDAHGNESRRVSCDVFIGDIVVPPVEDLKCAAVVTDSGGDSAFLSWSNAIDYTAIIIVRDGERIAELAGVETSFLDRNLEPGVYSYAVIALVDDLSSRPQECQVMIPGPPPRNLLFFSNGLFELDNVGDVIPSSINRPGRITCLASNSDPVQGWSFGVCSDPSVLEVIDVDLVGTVTEAANDGDGPSFLSLDRSRGGVTMAVIIDQNDTTDTLPPESGHRLLNITYGAAPPPVDQVPGDSLNGDVFAPIPGECFRIRHCNTLGNPPVDILYVVQGFEVVPATLPGLVCLPPPVGTFFRRGDANSDEMWNMADPVTILGWLFQGRRRPPCLEAADVNGSKQVNLADAVYAFARLFSGGPPPPNPFPDCGIAELALGCLSPGCPQPLPADGQ